MAEHAKAKEDFQSETINLNTFFEQDRERAE